jgi:antitoxin component of MazEF toxin-antitoxin module
VFAISSVARQGLDELIQALAGHLEQLRRSETDDTAMAEDEPYDPLKS